MVAVYEGIELLLCHGSKAGGSSFVDVVLPNITLESFYRYLFDAARDRASRSPRDRETTSGILINQAETRHPSINHHHQELQQESS